MVFGISFVALCLLERQFIVCPCVFTVCPCIFTLQTNNPTIQANP